MACIANSSEHTQRLNLGVEMEKLIELGFSHHHKLSIFLDTSGARKWLSMGLIKVSISSIALLLHVLMSTHDPMWFEVFHHFRVCHASFEITLAYLGTLN